jgi:hypothetical protein
MYHMSKHKIQLVISYHVWHKFATTNDSYFVNIYNNWQQKLDRGNPPYGILTWSTDVRSYMTTIDFMTDSDKIEFALKYS